LIRRELRESSFVWHGRVPGAEFTGERHSPDLKFFCEFCIRTRGGFSVT
jgi:hypothetical protein